MFVHSYIMIMEEKNEFRFFFLKFYTENIYILLQPLESKKILYCAIRIVQLRIVQYKIVFDSKGLKQEYNRFPVTGSPMNKTKIMSF
jgi:hypothetical protein